MNNIGKKIGGRSGVVAFFVIVFLIIAGVVGYHYWKKKKTGRGLFAPTVSRPSEPEETFAAEGTDLKKDLLIHPVDPETTVDIVKEDSK